MENARHRVLNFKLSKLDPSHIHEKLQEVFENFNCAVKINLALGFGLRNVDTEYAHENSAFFEKSSKGAWSHLEIE